VESLQSLEHCVKIPKIVIYTGNIKDDSCSICLCSIRRTRGTRQLSCGHLYHKKCINEWKDSSKNTCPNCRQSFDLSKYKVTITIENTENEEVQSLTLPYSNIVQLFEGLNLQNSQKRWTQHNFNLM
jgi:hypothetical protein